MTKLTPPQPESDVLERLSRQIVLGRDGKCLSGVDTLKHLLWEQHMIRQIRTTGNETLPGNALDYIELLEQQLDALNNLYVELMVDCRKLTDAWDNSPSGTGHGLEASFYDWLERIRKKLPEPARDMDLRIELELQKEAEGEDL